MSGILVSSSYAKILGEKLFRTWEFLVWSQTLTLNDIRVWGHMV